MIYMFQEQERLHDVSPHDETSGQDLLLAVGLHHLEVSEPEARSRSVHMTSLQDLADHHLLRSGNDLLRLGEVVSMEVGLLEEPTHHLATLVTEVATDQDLALLQDVMTGPHFRTIPGDAHRHLVPLDQRLLVLRDGLHHRSTRTGQA